MPWNGYDWQQVGIKGCGIPRSGIMFIALDTFDLLDFVIRDRVNAEFQGPGLSVI
jgi:hypothetical protein